MQAHRHGDALHLRRTFKTCEYSPSSIAHYFTVVALRTAHIRLHSKLIVSFAQSFGLSKLTDLNSVNSQRKIKNDKYFISMLEKTYFSVRRKKWKIFNNLDIHFSSIQLQF